MPSVKATDRWLRGHQPKATREEWTDLLAPGLLIRFGPAGAVFYARLHVGGKYIRQRIGPFPDKGLEEARTAVRDLVRARNRMEMPENPDTFAALCKLYLEKHARPKKRTAAVEEAIMERDLLPAFGARRADSIKPLEIARFLDSVVERGAPVQANRIRSLLSRIFSFGLAREIVTTNPAKIAEKPTKEFARETLLTDPQIVAFWRALEYRHPVYRHLMRFLLLTGQRVSEARELRWSEVAGDLWELPAARSKNGKPHVIPLSDQAIAVLDALKTLALGGSFAFPAPKNLAAPWDINSISSAAREMRAQVGVEWQPKDLRRTAATIMSRLGHRPWVPRVLNHTEQGVTSVYDRYAYIPEKRAALAALGDHVQALLETEGILDLRRSPSQLRTSERSQPTE